MKIKLIYSCLITSVFLFSCKEETPVSENQNGSKKPLSEVENNDTQIETLFDDTSFETGKMKDLLKELGLGMCNPEEKNEENYKVPACSPKFFKFFNFKEGTKIENAFVLLVKARVHDFPLRRVFVFQREKGKLIKVNGFIANLIGKRKSATGYEDLVLRFNDEDQNHFNCVFVWRDKRYEYDRVEQINDADIKPIYQDSMNIEIQKVLVENRMQF